MQFLLSDWNQAEIDVPIQTARNPNNRQFDSGNLITSAYLDNLFLINNKDACLLYQKITHLSTYLLKIYQSISNPRITY